MGGETSDGDSTKELKTDEIFPSQACVQNICSIPDLPQGRPGHTLSILSSGSFVVCGGIGEEYFFLDDFLDDCLVLTKFGTANASWVHHDTYMRFASL